MAEYIDLDTPLEVYVERGRYCEKKITSLRELLDVNHLRYEIADVRPVVRGKWEYNPRDNIPYCSECMMPQDSECNFCPNCGADMREES